MELANGCICCSVKRCDTVIILDMYSDECSTNINALSTIMICIRFYVAWALEPSGLSCGT